MLLYSAVEDTDRIPDLMPKPRASRLETPTARRKLAVRKKPYYVRLSPGIHLGYRRNVAAGTWTVRVAESGAAWIKKIALADDLEAASPPTVLNYWQAIDQARALARRQPGDAFDESRPLTVSEALIRRARRGACPSWGWGSRGPRAVTPFLDCRRRCQASRTLLLRPCLRGFAHTILLE